MKHQSGLLWTGPCRVKPRPALPNHVRSALSWDIAWHRVVIPYHCFWTIYWLHFQRRKYKKNRNKVHLKLTESSFGRRWTLSITRCLTRYIGSRLLCLFSGRKHPKLCTLITLKLGYYQSVRSIGIVTCWGMHLRWNLAEGTDWKMSIEKLRIDH
jgi:hypothetical protein